MMRLFFIFCVTLLSACDSTSKKSSLNTGTQAIKAPPAVSATVVEGNQNRAPRALEDKYKLMLKETIALSADRVSLKALLENILPGWRIKIPQSLQAIKVDAVIQTTRKQAINDVLSQVKAQGSFYEKITPNPILVVYEN